MDIRKWWSAVQGLLAAALAITAWALAIGLLVAGCATPYPGYGPGDFARNVGSRVVSGLPRVEIPILTQLGITPTGQNVILVNGTPFWCRWIVYGTEIGQTGPGDRLVGSKHFEPLSPQIPTAVMCYRDPGFQQYIGATGRIFGFYSGQPGGISWALRASELQTPEGAYSPVGLGVNYPQPDTQQSGKIVEMPRESWNATAAVQIVNNTLFTMSQGLEGTRRVTTDAGGLYYVSVRELLGPGRSMTGQLVFTDRGRLVGTYDFSFGVPSQGVIAHQLIVSPWMIRR